MEQDKPFETYQPHLFPRLERAGAFLSSVWNAGHVTELCLTEHKTGAAEMLDQHSAAQPELPFDKWDDMGCYIDRSRN